MRTFPCGCKFQETKDGLIYEPDIHKIPLDCFTTWDLICEGRTKGVFQLESQLASSTSKKAKPRNIDELSDVISIIRPGCLQSFIDNKSLTEHYIDRKNKVEDVEYFHPSLEPILKNTFGILVYQEQTIKISQELAGFSLVESDILRRAMGKKKADVMAQVQKTFIEKAADAGVVNAQEAKEIFSWIRASQRYAFNASHSVSYAYNSYLTAYTKAHFPINFYKSWLKYAHSKPKPLIEVAELVNDARLFNIEIVKPSIRYSNKGFSIIDKKPTFGLSDIKGIGESLFDKIEHVSVDIDMETCEWDEFLIFACTSLDKTAIESMIEAGACDCFSLTRAEMLHQYKLVKDLGKRETIWLKQYKREHRNKNILEILEEMVRISKELPARERPIYKTDKIQIIEDVVDSIKNPDYDLSDTPTWIAQKEKELLGVALTCSKIDDYDISNANCSCVEFQQGFNENHIRMAVQIDAVRHWKIKQGPNKGNPMAFMQVSDGTGSLDNITVFTNQYLKYKDKLRIGSIVLLQGTRGKRDGLIVNKIREL